MDTVLYRFTNKINNKQYYGISIEPEKRKRGHLYWKSSGCKRFKDAVKKYGPDGFNYEIMVVGGEEYICDLEKKCIAAFNSLHPNGYNISKGGKISSEEGRAKMSAGRRGRKLSPDHRAKVAANNRARNKANIGKKQSKEHIAKRIAAIKLKQDAGEIDFTGTIAANKSKEKREKSRIGTLKLWEDRRNGLAPYPKHNKKTIGNK